MKLVQQVLALTSLSLALTAQAESDINSGAAAGLNAATRLDFRVAVPRMIFLRIGSGVNFTDNATINRVTFTVTPANVGSGVAVLGVPSAGAVQARVLSNGGNVSFTARGVLGGLGIRRSARRMVADCAFGFRRRVAAPGHWGWRRRCCVSPGTCRWCGQSNRNLHIQLCQCITGCVGHL